jgi:hypothetical protein
VLAEFAADERSSRKAYCAFVEAGIDRPPRSPLSNAIHGLVLGSDRFVSKVKGLLKTRGNDPDSSVPPGLRARPPIARIVQAVSLATGANAATWVRGRRSDDGTRALAAYIARERYAYPSVEIAAALGYSSHSAVHRAVAACARADAKRARALQNIEARLASD